MKILPTLLLIILSCSVSFAQKDLLPGYVIKDNSPDTLRGFIRERSDWSRPYIEFSRSTDNKMERIPIENVKMFYLKPYDSYYYKTIVDIDKKPRLSALLENTPGRRIVRDTVLLRLVVGGTASLFAYEDENAKQHFFIQKNKNDIQELDYVRYVGPQMKFVEMRYYVEILKPFVADCPTVTTTDVRYEESLLAKLVKKYNSCFESVSYAAERPGVKVRLGASGGFGPTKLDFNGQDLKSSQDANATTSKFSSTSSLLIGLGVDIMSRREATRIIPNVSLTYQKVGASTASNENLITRINLKASNFSFIHTGASIKFVLNPRNKLQAYVKGGGSFAFLIDSNTTYTSTNKYTKEVTKPTPFALPSKPGFAAMGGVGITFGRVDAEINFMKNFVTASKPPVLYLKTLSVVVGFRFMN